MELTTSGCTRNTLERILISTIMWIIAELIYLAMVIIITFFLWYRRLVLAFLTSGLTFKFLLQSTWIKKRALFNILCVFVFSKFGLGKKQYLDTLKLWKFQIDYRIAAFHQNIQTENTKTWPNKNLANYSINLILFFALLKKKSTKKARSNLIHNKIDNKERFWSVGAEEWY